MKILVTGGRNYSDRETVYRVLDEIHATQEITAVAHGGANGADSLANDWCQSRRVGVRRFAADWKMHGRAAGPIRNARMLEEFKPNLIVAFPGGRGTADMVSRGKRAGVPVREME